MKTPLFMLGAAVLSLAAGAADAATDPAVQTFLDRAQAQAESQMAAAGVDLAGRSGAVQAYIGSDGRLKAVHVVSPQSPCAGDRDVKQAVRAMRLDDVPPALIDAKLTLVLGHAGVTSVAAP